MANCKPENKHELKDILSLLMEECDIDDAQLARETGVPASTISRMRINENSNPTASTLRPLSKYFSVSINQLLGDEPLPADRLPGTHHPTIFTESLIPFLEWNWISDWIQTGAENLQKKIKTWIPTEKKLGFNAFAIEVPTDSLGLAFRKGSTLLIDPSQSPKDGDLIIVQIENQDTFLLKQYLLDGRDIYLRSINPEIKNTTALNEFHKIIGLIVETRYSLNNHKTPASQRIMQTKEICTDIVTQFN